MFALQTLQYEFQVVLHTILQLEIDLLLESMMLRMRECVISRRETYQFLMPFRNEAAKKEILSNCYLLVVNHFCQFEPTPSTPSHHPTPSWGGDFYSACEYLKSLLKNYAFFKFT